MSQYRQTFPKRNTFLAVVHAEETEQVVRNVAIAHDNGADGVFLINHSIDVLELIDCYTLAREKFSSLWMGINPLGLSIDFAVAMMPEPQTGLWRDNAGITETGPSYAAKMYAESRSANDRWNGIYFGGVAFKYQPPVADPAVAARIARQFVDVIVTSGDGTGIAADVGKICAMKAACGDYPLAIASGITPENVELYMPYADCFLVATGVSDSHTELNAGRVKKLARMCEQ